MVGLVTCTECGRSVDELTTIAEAWTYWTDGRDLRPFCAAAWRARRDGTASLGKHEHEANARRVYSFCRLGTYLIHSDPWARRKLMHWVWFIIVGAVVGALGRLFHPGRDAMGWLLTIAIGVVSMIVAAAISSGWLAFIIGVIIAVVLVAGVAMIHRDRPLGRA